MLKRIDAMKVLVNGLVMNDSYSGVEYSLHHLMDAMSQRTNPCAITLLVSKQYHGGIRPTDQLDLQTLNIDLHSKYKRVLFENLQLGRYFSKRKFDLFHSPVYVLPFFARMPSLVTIHDLIAIEFPELCHDRTALYYNLAIPLAVRKAIRIIAVSETVRKSLTDRFNIQEDRIDVVFHGVDEIFQPVHAEKVLKQIAERYGLPERYILFVGNLEPKKNLPRLIRAFLEMRRHTDMEHALVIVGKKGWKYSEIFDLVKKEKADNEIIFTGYVDREHLPAIYTMADVFVFPSLYEGFGLPVLEAMACGTPVLFSNAGALPEIGGRDFPMADPYSVDDLAGKLTAIVQDRTLREKMVAYGLRNIRRFSWTEAAEKTVASYQKALYARGKGY